MKTFLMIMLLAVTASAQPTTSLTDNSVKKVGVAATPSSGDEYDADVGITCSAGYKFSGSEIVTQLHYKTYNSVGKLLEDKTLWLSLALADYTISNSDKTVSFDGTVTIPAEWAAPPAEGSSTVAITIAINWTDSATSTESHNTEDIFDFSAL